MASSRRVIDGDGHVEEDASLEEYLDPVYRRVLGSASGVKRDAVVGRLFPPPSVLHAEPMDLLEGSLAAGGPKEWSEFLDELGIEQATLYPSRGLSIGNVLNRDWAIALARAYNDWFAATYRASDPRLLGMALLPLQDVAAAIEELGRAVTDLGAIGAVLPATGLRENLAAKEYWPVYEEASRLGCAVAVHGGLHAHLGLDKLDTFAPIHALGHPFGLMRALGGLVFNGVFDRYPNLRMGFLEGGVAWLLVCLERFDRSYATHRYLNPRGEFLELDGDRTISDYLIGLIDAGRLFVGCEGSEPGIADAVRAVGDGAFLFSTDFPHEVNAEMCRREINEIAEHPHLSPGARSAILARNAERFYRLAAPGRPPQ